MEEGTSRTCRCVQTVPLRVATESKFRKWIFKARQHLKIKSLIVFLLVLLFLTPSTTSPPPPHTHTHTSSSSSSAGAGGVVCVGGGGGGVVQNASFC